MQPVPTMILGGLAILAAATQSIASAAIPQSERDVLLALYDSTNGEGWGNHFGWGDVPGTECSWYGITCNQAGTHVTHMDMSANYLSGTLPPLTGLANLEFFVAVNNQLTGPIPPLAGLTHLEFLQINFNALTGPIPPLAGLVNLRFFDAGYNQLTGSIPSLAGLVNLGSFEVTANQLSGPIPSLADLASIGVFKVGDNQLSGPIPSLAGLVNLQYFEIMSNQLSGSVPSLADLTSIATFKVGNNQLSGDMPNVPTPNALFQGGSQLCPNFLNPTSNIAWDAATGQIPWYQDCSPLPDPIYADGFDGP